jgi:50S ribosomal subunit-associated GTPase HflX
MRDMSDVLKAIKSCRNVFIEVMLNNTCIIVKVNKRDLVAQLTGRVSVDPDQELVIVTQYGRESLYLGRREL